MKILVVDDEKLLVKGIKFNLENEGYQVETAFDGAAAVELAKSESFDLIILDLMMPEVDGLTACMRIREFSAVPIIMLTARSEDADKIIGLESGADDYVTKPFNILELKARIRALLRRAGQTAQKRTELLTAGGMCKIQRCLAFLRQLFLKVCRNGNVDPVGFHQLSVSRKTSYLIDGSRNALSRDHLIIRNLLERC